MVVTIIILSIFLILLSWITVVQISRCSKLEHITNNVVANMQNISSILEETSTVLNDDKLLVAFSNDDEVGRFFSQIKEIQAVLDKFIIKNGKKESSK